MDTVQNTKFNLSEEAKPVLSMDPLKFTLWLFIVSIVMLFASQTSAYLVRRAEGNWMEFEIPSIFIISSIILVISSLTMHWALVEARRDNFQKLRIAISVTFVLGLIFLGTQFEGWRQLVAANVYFVGNPSGSFVYVFTALHGFHLITGLIVLVAVMVASFKMKVHSKRLRRIEICATYWHFLDLLWIYLYVFLLTFN